jgi:hypothetical protein
MDPYKHPVPSSPPPAYISPPSSNIHHGTVPVMPQQQYPASASPYTVYPVSSPSPNHYAQQQPVYVPQSHPGYPGYPGMQGSPVGAQNNIYYTPQPGSYPPNQGPYPSTPNGYTQAYIPGQTIIIKERSTVDNTAEDSLCACLLGALLCCCCLDIFT